MYRSSPEQKKQTETNFNNILGGFNSFDMKCFQEMYLETCNSLSGVSTESASISPASSSSTSGSLSPSSSNSSLSNVSTASSTSSGSAGGGGEGCFGIGGLTALQEQQLLAAHQQHQQHLAAAAVAQHQLAMAAANAANQANANSSAVGSGNQGGTTTQQKHDEISKSLKMFAMLTAYSTGNESTTTVTPQLPHSPVDAVMQDFACNGYICDERNRYQLGMHLSNSSAIAANASLLNAAAAATNQHQTNSCISNANAAAAAAAAAAASLNQQQLQQLQQQHNLNINFNNNFWKMLPSHMQQHTNAVTAAAAAAAAATAAAAVNMDYNCNQKKMPKRYNGTKNEKYSPAKHCVFCENNNEPEAVVKSHAVRDSLGRVLCPKLRTYICPICKASGDMAHTVKYCPQKPIITMEDAIKAESFRLAKGTYYKQQMKV